MADINEELYDAALQFALSQTTFEKSASRVENETEAKQNLDSI